MDLEEAARAVITVGNGRGFAIKGFGWPPRIITAASCLPHLPSCDSTSACVFPQLLAPLGAEPSISAYCLFADPISDVAILEPINDDDGYYHFPLVEHIEPLEAAEAGEYLPAFLLSLRNRWFSCSISGLDSEYTGPRSLYIRRAEHPFVDGMSGSPIVDGDGRAIGIVCVLSDNKNRTEGGGHPHLIDSLPGWYVRNCERPAR